MNNAGSFENLKFNRSVNTISTVPTHFPLHWHKYIEITAVVADSSAQDSPRIRINQEVYTLENGDLAFVWPGEVHEIVNNSSKNMIAIQFSPAIFNELQDFAPYLNLFRSFHVIRHDEHPALAESMQVCMQQMLKIQQSQDTFKDTECLISLYEMFMEFGEHVKNNLTTQSSESKSASNKTLAKMRQACSYIAANCEYELTLESVAENIGFSPCYFSRVFKQTVGYHFVEYLTLQRVRQAQTLLAETNASITDISYQSGFKSISTFNRVFRQYRGCSPSEYRKYYQG